MDSVRFGRVLGVGARLAGKTLMQAVDAAAAPNPRAKTDPAASAARPLAGGEVIPLEREKGLRAGQQIRATGEGVQRGGKRFGQAVWRPFTKASGVLWLEVTGVFFGLIALFGLQGIWVYRGAFQGGPEGHAMLRHLLMAAALTLIFGYFCVTSFVRASRKGRQP